MNADLQKWVDVWEKAMEKGIFPETPKQEINPQVYDTDYFGNVRKDGNANMTLNDCDTKYWNQVYQMSNHNNDTPDILHEQINKIDGIGTEEPIESEPVGKTRKTPTGAALGTKGAELANTANPQLQPSSRGIDQRDHVTPDWSDGKNIRELVRMKNNLYKLEVKLNSNPKFGAYGPDAPEVKKIQAQINDLREKIDELSNSLSPDFVQDELS